MKRKPDKSLKVVPEPTKQELAAQLVDLFKKATGGEYSGRPAREVARQCYSWIFENKTELHVENVTLLARMATLPEQIELVNLPGQGVGFVERRGVHVIICSACADRRGLKTKYDKSTLHVLAGQGGPRCHFCNEDRGGADIFIKGAANDLRS